MENKTEMGLLLIIFGMVLSIFSTLGSVSTGSLGSSSFSPGVIIAAIISFFGTILMLVGWILMLTGRREFGDEHGQSVIYSLIAFVIGFVVIIIGSVIMVIGAMSGVMMGGVEDEIDYSQMAQGMTQGIIVMQVGQLIFLVGAILLVYKLENDIGRVVLYLALVVSIIVAIISTFILSSALNELMDTMENTPEEEWESEFEDFSRETSSISALGAIGTVLIMIGYIIPYNRIKKGELKPITPPPPAYGMPPYPPPYPYPGPYPPYQQPPYQQPPYQPAQQPEGRPGDKAQPGPSPVGPVQPQVVSLEPVGIKNCPHCGTQIPIGSTTCPVCKKDLR